MTNQSSRREFLKTGAAIAAAAVATPSAAAPRREIVSVGVIGAGGRGRHLLSRAQRVPGVRIAAVCDVYEKSRRLARELAEGEPYVDSDFRKTLGRDDLDAVIIATPDHWHVPMTVAACEAGKDVYVEKPLTHDPAEGQAVIDAQNRHQRIVQIGTQHRSMPHLIEANGLVRSGELGSIYKAGMAWNRFDDRWVKPQGDIDPKTVDWQAFLGSAPAQPFDPYRFVHWRWFWDFGGGVLTDLMVHWLDTVHWMLDVETPASAMTIGSNFRTDGLWETPDTVQTLLGFDTAKLQAHFEGGFVNRYRGSMLALQGDRATLYMDRGRYELTPQPGSDVKKRELVIGEGRKGADWYPANEGALPHLTNWIECVRSRERPNCPAEEGVRSALGAHLANRAYRSGELARRGA